MKKYFFIILLAALLAACSSNEVVSPKKLVLTPAQQQMTAVSNDFSFSLLREIALSETEQSNIVVSPLSAAFLLGMVANGADGETYEQLKTALGFGKDYPSDDINEYYRVLLDALPALDASNKVCIANSMWAQKDFPFLDSFVATEKKYFYAKVDNVDFADSRTADKINKWVADNTKNLIKDVVSPADLQNAVMVLANALYFKGIWQDKFKKEITKPFDFTTSDGSTVKADMMQRTAVYLYGEFENGQLLEINYKDGKYCMDIFLPARESSLNDVVATLDAEQWNDMLKHLLDYKVNVRLPKAELSYNKRLNESLQSLGITSAFSPAAADFSRMSERDVYLSLVKQMCYMKVDEEGTEAAAVTIGVIAPTAVEPEPMPNFYVDRPYMMLIREKQYGTVLFTALVGNPMVK